MCENMYEQYNTYNKIVLAQKINVLFSLVSK